MHVSTVGRCILALTLTVSVAANQLMAEDEFQITTPQTALVVWAKGQRAYVEVQSANSREVWIKRPGSSKPTRYRAEQINLIQTGNDIFIYNGAKTAFESSRKRAKELASEVWVDQPQSAMVRLVNERASTGELVLLSARTLWFKADNVALFEVFQCKDVSLVQTGDDIFRYDRAKACFESSRKREKELAGGTWVDRRQSATVRLANGKESNGELILLSARTLWFKADSAATLSGRQGGFGGIGMGLGMRGPGLGLGSNRDFNSNNIFLFDVFNAKDIEEIKTPTLSWVYDEEKDGLVRKGTEKPKPPRNLFPVFAPNFRIKSSEPPSITPGEPKPNPKIAPKVSSQEPSLANSSESSKPPSQADAWLGLIFLCILGGCGLVGALVGAGIAATKASAEASTPNGGEAVGSAVIWGVIGGVAGLILGFVIFVLLIILLALGMALIPALIAAAVVGGGGCTCCCCRG